MHAYLLQFCRMSSLNRVRLKCLMHFFRYDIWESCQQREQPRELCRSCPSDHRLGTQASFTTGVRKHPSIMYLYHDAFFFSFSGVDICGRTVMVVVGRNIPVTLIDMEKVKEKILILPFARFCVWQKKIWLTNCPVLRISYSAPNVTHFARFSNKCCLTRWKLSLKVF